MRLATGMNQNGQPIPMLLVEEGFVDLSEFDLATARDVLLVDPEDLRAMASSGRYNNGQLPLLAPLVPRSVIVTGTNYRSHNAEMGVAGPARPTANLIKLPSAVTGTGDTIAIPDGCLLDYEAEIAVVIGRSLVDASPATAIEAIFGLCLANDLSARDAPTTHLSLAKGGKGFCPLGPWITTLDEVDVSELVFELQVNGEIRQRGLTSDMIHPIAEIVSSFSQSLPLHPGDVILTGSPSGVGVSHSPPVFLNAGDVVRISSPQLGTLVNMFSNSTSIGDSDDGQDENMKDRS